MILLRKNLSLPYPCLLCHVSESDSWDSFNNLPPVQEMLRALLANTDLTDTEISLHYVYLQYHLGLGTACVLLFYKPEMSQHSSWFPLVAQCCPVVCPAHGAHSLHPQLLSLFMGPSFKTLSSGVNPLENTQMSPWRQGDFCHQLQWIFNFLIQDTALWNWDAIRGKPKMSPTHSSCRFMSKSKVQRKANIWPISLDSMKLEF